MAYWNTIHTAWNPSVLAKNCTVYRLRTEGPLLLRERELLLTIIKTFWLNYFPCWKRNYIVSGFRKRKEASLHDSFCGGIVGRGLRLHDPQTHVARLISVGISWNNFAVKIQEFWKTLNVILNRLLPAVSNKLFEYFQDNLWNGWMFLLKKVENTFSIPCNYIFELVYHIICTF